MATIIAVLLAIPMGTLAALFRDTWIDYTVRILTIGGLSIPSFWFGMLIMITLLYLFNWLPPITFTPIYVDPVARLHVEYLGHVMLIRLAAMPALARLMEVERRAE